MGAGAIIAPLAQAGIGAATSGKGGGSSHPQGGVSPEQEALAQYTYGQDLLRARSGYADTGTGASTMATQASGGARNKMAKSLAGASDVNQQLQIAAQTQLQQLAQQNEQNQGFAAGSQGGGQGGSGFGSSTNTTGDSSSTSTG